MSNNFKLHATATFRQGPEHASSREGLDFVIAALSMDLAVAVVFEQNGVALCDADHPFASAVKRLPMLEDIFDAEHIYIYSQAIPCNCVLESVQLINKTQRDEVIASSKHQLTF